MLCCNLAWWKKHAVTLFHGENGEPRQYCTCTCSSTVTCSHIMAAMLSIGYIPRKTIKDQMERECEETWKILVLELKENQDPPKHRRKNPVDIGNCRLQSINGGDLNGVDTEIGPSSGNTERYLSL